MTLELVTGKPKNYLDRSNTEQNIYAFLDSLCIAYKHIDHCPLSSMEEYSDIEKEFDICIPKNLFLCNRQQTEFYLLIMPGDKKFITKNLSKQINAARLSFASSEQLSKLLNCYHGSTNIFSLIFDADNKIRLLIDEDLLKKEVLGFHPCENTSTVVINKSTLFDTIIPSIKHTPIFVKL